MNKGKLLFDYVISYVGEGAGCLGTGVAVSYALAEIIERNQYPSFQGFCVGISLAIATVYFSYSRQVIESKLQIEKGLTNLEERQRRLEEIVHGY